ncbi:beta-ketoacyl synthase N-terminal-like domain-containing protein [Pyxidicoccus sp. 3LFB2]
MSETKPELNRQEVLAKALAEIKHLRVKAQAAEREKREPIAIVGMACRFPGGADSPEAFWRLLRDGVDATSSVPKERWDAEQLYDEDPEAPGKLYVRRGGFLDGVDRFDAGLFGISAREAAAVDPQHRMFWELCWEALERAGRAPLGLAGSATGVYVGISNHEYPPGGVEPTEADPLMIGGNATSFITGRLSYMLGLRGPSVALDTACSSSLVAVHLACQSLRSRETDLALAGGVNLILSPNGTLLLCKARALAPDGRCKAFDASADGYGRGEGGGVVVLERLSDALARRAPILAVIRGSAVNQDGHRSGLTVPNPKAQTELIRAALASAGVRPSDVQCVEAHGTGTALGDPIEMRALGEVYAEGRALERPLWVGSVKTNLGHLESAAGIAGLLKTVLALRHGQLPPHLHFTRPNPDIPWHALPVQVNDALRPWEREGGRRIAGVSSFGGSGTNAHVVLEEAPDVAASPAGAGEEPAQVLTLSAKQDEALRALAARYEAHLAENPTLSLPELCFTANTGRAHLSHRLAVVGRSTSELRALLQGVVQGREEAGVISGVVRGEARPRVAFLFTGQGSQYVGMGRGLYQTQPVFRRALDRCAELFAPWLSQPLLSVMHAEEAGPEGLLNQTAFTQPALFSLGYALAELWRSLGVEPVAVLGHSVGELAAACVAGVLSLEDSVTLVAERAKRMQALPPGGAMFAAACGEEAVRAVLSTRGPDVSIAALNGPAETVLSGEEGAVTAVVDALKSQGIQARRIPVSHAFHSARMEPMLEDFERAISHLSFQAPRLKQVSGLTGRLDGAAPGAAWWRRQLREPVRFSDGVRALAELGVDTFIELGPSPTLSSLARTCLPEGSHRWLPSLKNRRDDAATFLGSVARLYASGADLRWEGLSPDGLRRLELPTYPFQRQRYWMQGRAAAAPAPRVREGHPLLGVRTETPDGPVFETEVRASDLAVLRDFRVFGTIVVSGVVQVSLIILAGAEVLGGKGQARISELVFFEPFTLDDEAPMRVRLLLSSAEAGQARFELHSAPASQGATPEWRRHCAGTLAMSDEGGEQAGDASTLNDIRARCTDELSAEAFYRTCWSDTDQSFGPSFKGLTRVWWGDGELLAEIEPTETGLAEPEAAGFAGRVLTEACAAEACAQAMKVLRPKGSDFASSAYLGVGMQRSHATLTSTRGKRFGHARMRPSAPGETRLFADVRLLDADGRVVTTYEGLSYAPIQPEMLRRLATRPKRTRASGVDRAQLLSAAKPERSRLLETYLLRQMEVLHGAAVPGLAPDAPLGELGLDSIQFTELRGWIRKDLDVQLAPEQLTASTSPRAIAEALAARLAPESAPVAPVTVSPPVHAGEWIAQWERPPAHEARLRLFCFPFAGGGASTYRGWDKALPRGVDVCRIQFPGRESRYGEPPVEHLSVLLDTLERELAPLLDLPFAFFGTSMGGLLAFELARRIRARRGVTPVRLFTAASYAPHRGPSAPLAELIRTGVHSADPALLRRFKVVPDALFASPDMLALVLPPLYADLKLVGSYQYADEPALACPITALCGTQDPLMTRDNAASWSHHTVADFSLRMIAGEHLFVRTAPEAVLDVVREELSRHLAQLERGVAKVAS